MTSGSNSTNKASLQLRLWSLLTPPDLLGVDAPHQSIKQLYISSTEGWVLLLSSLCYPGYQVT